MPMPDRWELVSHEVSTIQVSHQLLRFPPISIIPSILHTQFHNIVSQNNMLPTRANLLTNKAMNFCSSEGITI
jgi:hypothetical protein